MISSFSPTHSTFHRSIFSDNVLIIVKFYSHKTWVEAPTLESALNHEILRDSEIQWLHLDPDQRMNIHFALGNNWWDQIYFCFDDDTVRKGLSQAYPTCDKISISMNCILYEAETFRKVALRWHDYHVTFGWILWRTVIFTSNNEMLFGFLLYFTMKWQRPRQVLNSRCAKIFAPSQRYRKAALNNIH